VARPGSVGDADGQGPNRGGRQATDAHSRYRAQNSITCTAFVVIEL